ncbi:MAG: hypothetical protein BBJ60_03310 [Desulfobacterales bacterium S7086C20]|nr:MAG: hypothetical protein BBJ60_03310 [Desulfobacterales bacterium S7086C20]
MCKSRFLKKCYTINIDHGYGETTRKIGQLGARAKINSQSWRTDLVRIWPIRLSKTAGIASYFEDFVNEASVKDGLKLRCQNVKLFLREPSGRKVKLSDKGKK